MTAWDVPAHKGNIYCDVVWCLAYLLWHKYVLTFSNDKGDNRALGKVSKNKNIALVEAETKTVCLLNGDPF